MTTEIRRPTDGELLGTVEPRGHAFVARTVFGGTLGERATHDEAAELLRRDGLAAMARRWFHRDRTSGTWQVVVLQEAWPGRVVAVEGPYALAGAPTITITAADLEAGDVLTLEPPLDQPELAMFAGI